MEDYERDFNTDEGKELPNYAVTDQPCRVDFLGFKPYVEAIATFLRNPNTKPPLTLSIEGSWGSGKSSFMLQLCDELEKYGECTVKFNAWRHDKEDSLWATFVLEFLHQLSKPLSWYQRLNANKNLLYLRFSWGNVEEDLKHIFIYTALTLIAIYFSYSKVLEWISSLSTSSQYIAYIVSIISPIALILSPVITKVFGNPLNVDLKKYISSPDYENRTTFVDKFHEDFNKIIDCYVTTKKVFVFIDDLDRCEIPKAADLMQSLNLMISNNPRLVFVIGMDRMKVAAGLAAKYERLFPYLFAEKSSNPEKNGYSYDGLEYGYEFIEKFIQVPFQVPQADKYSLFKLL